MTVRHFNMVWNLGWKYKVIISLKVEHHLIFHLNEHKSKEKVSHFIFL